MPLRDKCDELDEANQQGGLAPAAELAVQSLLRLVEEGDQLDDELAADLQLEVEVVFGRVIAFAAVRGKLTFRPFDPDASVTGALTSTSHPEPAERALEPESIARGEAAPVTSEAVGSAGASPEEATETDVTEQLNSEWPTGIVEASETPSDPKLLVTGEHSTMPTAEVNGIPLTLVEGQSDLATLEFQSFQEFFCHHWVDASGVVVLAPWSTPGFAPAVSNLALQAWERGDAGMAYLFARAADEAGATPPLNLNDMDEAEELLSAPEFPTAGRQPERVDRLRQVMLSPNVYDVSFGVRLMLEALRPTLPCTFTPLDIEKLLERASYHDSAINEVITFLLNGWSSQVDPLESLRLRLLDARPEPLAKLEDSLRKAQEALKREVTALWSAAGGKIQRTHCRAAWTRFIQEQVVPLRDELAPSGPKGLASPKVPASSIGSRVVGIGRAFVRIMDSANVKHQDRSAADGAAQQIIAAVSHLADALLALETRRSQDRAKTSYDGIPFEAGMRLLAGGSSGTTDTLCASLFSAVLKQNPQPQLLRLSARHLLNHIDVIRFLAPAALTRAGIAKDGLRVRDVEEPRAASVLLQNWFASEADNPSSDEDFLSALRNVAAESTRRDVLAALSHTDVLLDHQRTLLHQHTFDLSAETFEATRRLEEIWSACDDLMVPDEARLKSVVDEAREMMRPKSDASISINKRLLRLTWLTRSIELAVTQRDDTARKLLEQAQATSPELAERAAPYFQDGDYRAGFALLHGGAVPEVDSGRRSGRRTLWRDDAIKLWREPRTKLAQDLRGSTEEQWNLADAWSSGAIEGEQRDSLPKLLFALVSGETERVRGERRPVLLGQLRELQPRKVIVNCGAIRRYFQKTGMNPTFLPQLAEFGQIVMTPLPQAIVRGNSVPSNWATEAKSDEATRVLYAFLAPGIALSRRDELCSDLRKRGITAAIIDDIDVCRLCASFAGSRPQSFVPFIEILLEQIDLFDASPFSSLDGQHVRLETYVGREQEARKIALGAEYTRLFSGRKLGKSALLKYVADRYDGRKLDSENTLNVFFITIAGGDSESWVVDAILAAMIERFGLQESPDARGLGAAARFMNYMNNFLTEKPGHSVLLILDEADAFVEDQLIRYNKADYNHDREGSLSFRMMKQLPAQDGKGLPRIRTLFSGYRTTNTRGGVWANAGDVLLLPPLEDSEAIKFLHGMLGRVGISLGSHAPFVAMRCGFQPAVLIRFGESLIKRLRRATRSAHREKLIVSREEVSATLAEQAVLDEIKTVVNNNFQGNRVGAVVFGATLLALKDLAPGFALTDGAVQVLTKLNKIDSNLDWLERLDSSPLAEIERHLQDFIDRGLLTQAESTRRLGDREYRLRFPHFLTVLTRQSDVEQDVRQQIQTIRAGGAQRRLAESVLSESALNTVRYWYREPDTAICKLVVVSGHWVRSLLDQKCGVPDRLGCDRYGLLDLSSAKGNSLSLPSGVRVLCNASAAHWSMLLNAPASRPLVLIGSLDLQRAAVKHTLAGSEVPVEVVTLGRMTQATLAWWFEVSRALHFSSSDAIARIAQATEFAPYLVDALDLKLTQSPGTDVTSADLQAALDQFEAYLPELASRLCDEAQPGHLLPREVQLLVMAAHVAEEVSDEFHLEQEFQDCWMMLGLSDAGIDAPLSQAGDWQAIKLLVDAGLLPTRVETSDDSGARSLGRVRFDRNGPLLRLIKALGSYRAA
ncbi:hypothetical protein EIP75_18425 [Aquabacterium soli]|uniref:Uncharacterized protein n=1 Tax=Aquabacterium soli TaxID=2493092 RepID=A0A426V7W6_9BURK|nr:hypothetical protein [Aquabacterium soli]RRS02932.1 hypothetical protein EIP75_18425 [Aquabacterium soli]